MDTWEIGAWLIDGMVEGKWWCIGEGYVLDIGHLLLFGNVGQERGVRTIHAVNSRW